MDKHSSAEDHQIFPDPEDRQDEPGLYNNTLHSTFSHCLKEDIPNTIEPILDEDFHKYLDPESPNNETPVSNRENPNTNQESLKNKQAEAKGERLWVVLKGELKDKRGNLIFEYFDPQAYPESNKFKHAKGALEVRGENVVYYYGKEKHYGLILYPRTSVLGHACFYEGYIEYGKPSDKGVFIGANCRYLVHSLNKKGGGVIRCLNYCNMFPYTKTKVFEQGSVLKCTSLLANGFIFYGLDEYGKGFFKLYGLDRLIRGALNGADFKLEIAGDVVYQDENGGKDIDDLLEDLRAESISDEMLQIKKSQELATISERTKSRHTFDSGSRKLAAELFSVGGSGFVNSFSRKSSRDQNLALKEESEPSRASFEKLIKKVLPSSSEEDRSKGVMSNFQGSDRKGSPNVIQKEMKLKKSVELGEIGRWREDSRKRAIKRKGNTGVQQSTQWNPPKRIFKANRIRSLKFEEQEKGFSGLRIFLHFRLV